jgi:hypothetical protein
MLDHTNETGRSVDLTNARRSTDTSEAWPRDDQEQPKLQVLVRVMYSRKSLDGGNPGIPPAMEIDSDTLNKG